MGESLEYLVIFCLRGSHSVGFCIGAEALTRFIKPFNHDGYTSTAALGQAIDYGAGAEK